MMTKIKTRWRFLAAAWAACLSLTLQAETWRASERLDAVIEQALQDGTAPGAVLLVGRDEKVLHRKAYGYRSVEPQREPMTLDTIFDCASLTKVVVTAPAILQLVEAGKIALRDPVTKHLPKFSGGDSPIRVIDLLTHFSGLRPDLDLEPEWSGYETGVQRAYAEVPALRPGSRFVYSDINYILLAEIIRQVTGEPLGEYARKNLFEPLGMTETRFRPPPSLQPRIAPTEKLPDGTILRGIVHDPTTRFMGGVAGHAGMFSTADDLSRFARMMLDLGRLGERRILSPLSVIKMTTPQSPPGQPVLRGLGWDIESPYSSNRGDLFPPGSYGHTGFTGTSVWIDPFTDMYVILLTNRVHPQPRSSIVSLRSRVANIVAAALEDIDEELVRRAYGRPRSGEAAELRGRAMDRTAAEVMTGLDVLTRDGFKQLRGKRVGLITNHTGIDRQGRRNVDLLRQAEGVSLQAIFVPEHGLSGQIEEGEVSDSVDAATGVPVHSLYQAGRRRPDRELLRGLDALVFDIQDVGARFYTYVTTMGYAMEEAAKSGVAFYVLDRPNPITGAVVEGPMLDAEHRSFIGYFPMPVRHGMTVGELARMFRGELNLKLQLEVIPMEGWERGLWFDETGLPWTDPSPNIRSVDQALLYPGVALLEGLRNYSVGRGTGAPFQFVGADWIDSRQLVRYLRAQRLAGVRFYPAQRKPSASRFAGRLIEGVQISVTDRDSVLSTRVGLEIAAALVRFYPRNVDLSQTVRLIGNQQTIERLNSGEDASSLWAGWETEIEKFLPLRRQYLLY